MSLKYRVKLIHSNGYAGIQDNIGKEFNATSMMGLYYIKSDELHSPFVPDNTYLVFDRNAVEVLEVETTHKLSGEQK